MPDAMIPLLPIEVCPDHPHVIALAPADRPGTASELVARGAGAATALFTVDTGCVGQAFRRHRAPLRAYLEADIVVLFCCATRRDRSEAKRRLEILAPAGWSVRE
jgi:hypothetical protein